MPDRSRLRCWTILFAGWECGAAQRNRHDDHPRRVALGFEFVRPTRHPPPPSPVTHEPFMMSAPPASRLRTGAAIYFVGFDLLVTNTQDLRPKPYRIQRARLAKVLASAEPPPQLAPVINGRATALAWISPDQAEHGIERDLPSCRRKEKQRAYAENSALGTEGEAPLSQLVDDIPLMTGSNGGLIDS
ncbi:hypothetical protein [Amycolatopsis anabasis]|uniref:hypothetical protein n=1 Tax=Amycolatopsis anabasis TaxID=1840409 RepID=UPI00131B20C6|nr:hypothetical protein [Amycolatopsis anabasis]